MSDTPRILYQSAKFGESSPYLVAHSANIVESFPDAVSALSTRRLDTAAIVSLLNFNYVVGDRTLIKGLSRFPWHSTLTEEGRIERGPPFAHGSTVLSEAAIADVFEDIMGEYVTEIASRHATLWLTLSGGYDSRVIAGLLQKYAKGNEIRVLNWGHPESRDVCYARDIAGHYGWSFTLVPYDPDKNLDSVYYAVEHAGAEMSPLDYNPLEVDPALLSQLQPDHAILFAHYGDGMGRASYSHRHVTERAPFRVGNPYFLYNVNTLPQQARIVSDDRALAWSTDQSPPGTIAVNELDMNENYLRRMLTKRFAHCHKYDPFCYPPLAEFVYSLDVVNRTDDVYRHLLKNLDPFLHDYPWARTGVSFSGRVDESGALFRQHSKQRDYLKLREMFADLLFDGALCQQGVINASALRSVMSLWPKDLTLSTVVAKLAAIEILVQRYDVEVESETSTPWSRLQNTLGSRAYGTAKRMRQWLR
ncbi:MAG: asparagine synthase-related protein [Pseudomonadota bacterium]